MTQITMTKKIEVYIDGSKEEKDIFYSFFRDNSRKYINALNLIYSQLMFDEMIEDSIKFLDEGYLLRESELKDKLEKLYSSDVESEKKKIEKIKQQLSKLRTEKSKEAREVLTEAIGLKKKTRTRDVAKTVNFSFADFADSANMKASQDFSNDFIGVKTGQRTPRVYRQGINKISLPFRGRDIKIYKDDKYCISLPKGFKLKVNLGRKSSLAGDITHTLNQIIAGEYKLNQSNLVIEGKKIYFNLVVTFDKDYQKLILLEDKVMSVSFKGLASGDCSIKDKLVSSFGDEKYIFDFKAKIQALKSKEQSKARFSKGGHGRARKINHDRWESIKLREGNFVRTYNNQCTARIVRTAMNNKCGKIIINSMGANDGSWAYYQFFEQVKQKAGRYNIVVEVI